MVFCYSSLKRLRPPGKPLDLSKRWSVSLDPPRLCLLPCCDHVVFKQALLMNTNVVFYSQNLANVSLRKGTNRRLLICYQAIPTQKVSVIYREEPRVSRV